jgi:hypothetical protein
MGSFFTKPKIAPLTIDALDMGQYAMLRDLVKLRNSLPKERGVLLNTNRP